MKKYLFLTFTVLFSNAIYSQFNFVSEQEGAQMFGDGFGLAITSEGAVLGDLTIYRTIDDWQTSQLIDTFDGTILSSISEIHLFNSNEGFLYGGLVNNTAYKTMDGGLTWEVFSSQDFTLAQAQVSFMNPDLIYSIGIDNDAEYHFQRVSSDTTETLFNMNILEGAPAAGSLFTRFKMDFLNEEYGFLAKQEMNSQMQLYKTDGPEINWEPIYETISGRVNDIFVQNENNIYACGNDGLFLKSEDGGLSWTQSQVGPEEENLDVIKFVNNELGYMAGTAGKIYQTEDGGESWTSQYTGSNESFWKINVIEQNVVYVSGNNSVYKKEIISNLNDLDLDAFSTSLFPNPATDVINLELQNQLGAFDWSILDSSGKILLEGSRNKIDISELAKGVYVINISLDYESKRLKFVKR